MQVLIGGVVAAVLGLVGLIAWWKQFLLILMGGIPIALLLGGALAIYVGYDEIKDQMREKKEKGKVDKEKEDELSKAKEELEKAKAEAEKYKAEAEKVKEKPKKKEVK
jgi:predicted membrane protein